MQTHERDLEITDMTNDELEQALQDTYNEGARLQARVTHLEGYAEQLRRERMKRLTRAAA